jgi:Hypothetical glycosyl hydrolase 6
MYELSDAAPVGAAACDVWWKRPYRMVQTNLRQPDALLDPVRLAKQTRDFGADVLLFNIGGIFAFYPTELKLQARNPYLKSDVLGEIIEACHAEGLSIVGRFDMSKATRIAYEAHPDWFLHNRAGKPLIYNGTYQACVNGGWYNDYAHQIIRESLGRYKVDGVFFNMFGYRSSDYSGNYHGICVCQNCRRRFRAMFGRELPEREDFSDPGYRDYLEFQDRTSLQLADAIYQTIKSVNPDVAMTGHRNHSDLIRMEVQRAVDRAQPEWPYQAGEQARWARAFGRGKTCSSTSANFIDYAWRFVAETGDYHVLRFAQQLANGATLDYYLLGTFDQDDTKPFPQVSALYKWHRDNVGCYRNLRPAARIGLYHSFKTNTYRGATRTKSVGTSCFRGAYRALAEARIAFDFLCDEHVGTAYDAAALLDRYDALLLPNVTCMSDVEAACLDDYVAHGGVILTTGETGFYGPRGEARDKPALTCLPISEIGLVRDDMRGAYFKLRDGELDLPGTTLMYLDGFYLHVKPCEGATPLLELLPPQRFGPPELCFSEISSDLPGVLTQASGKGKAIYLPWLPEFHYNRDSLPDHREIITQLLAGAVPPQPCVLQGEGPVEVTVQTQGETGRTLVHLVNYSGQRNNLYEAPITIHGLRLGIRRDQPAAVRALVGEVDLSFEDAAPDERGYLWLALPPLRAFEAIAIEP